MEPNVTKKPLTDEQIDRFIELYNLKDLTPTEIAQKIGCTVGQVNSLVLKYRYLKKIFGVWKPPEYYRSKRPMFQKDENNDDSYHISHY